MTPIAKRAPRVRGVAAFVVAYPLAHDLLDFLLGRRRACYGRQRRWRRGPASLGRRGRRRAPARLRLLRWTPAWRWSTPAACSVLGPRARRFSLATPRPRARPPPAARARGRARPPPFARPILTRARHTAVWSPVHARALTSHTRLTPFGSCRTDAFRCAAIHRCSQLARKAQFVRRLCKKVQSTAASVVRH